MNSEKIYYDSSRFQFSKNCNGDFFVSSLKISIYLKDKIDLFH